METKPLSTLVLATGMLGLFLRDYPEFKEILINDPMLEMLTAAIHHVNDTVGRHSPEETYQRLVATILEEYKQ